jgi:alpha-glucosidase
MSDEHLWWQRGTVYQIYPRSFQDSDGDGVGDLRGITSRLDYVQWLGVDAIWLSPIFPSPMADFGYDVANYVDIDPLFGTLADFDLLVAAAHARGLKVMLDFVPNHSSDEHPWFVESRASRDNPKRDWYVWRDPAPGGGPPNNWLSFFGGGAWEWDAATGQYYLHLFHKKQPDLNWRHPEVRRVMLDALRFWLDRGVDGFRVDVMWLLIKDEQFRDNPPNPDYREGEHPLNRQLQLYTMDQPETHTIVAEWRRLFDQYDERMMVGEIYLPVERLVSYYGENGTGAHLPFNFHLIMTDAMACAADRHPNRYLRGRSAGPRLAELGAWQPRPASYRQPRRRRPGPRGGDAASDAARHTDDLLWRRDRHARRRYPTRSGTGSAGAWLSRHGPRPRP